MSPLRAALLLLLCSAALACTPEDRPPVVPPDLVCEDLQPLTFEVLPTRVRLGEPVQLIAAGGTGRYRFSAQPGGSGGRVLDDKFLAGQTPGTDTLIAEDAACEGRATATVEVLASFSVRPARATVKPGTTFTLSVSGMMGTAMFRMVNAGSGGTITAAGKYTAGSGAGLDLVEVRDATTGDQAVLQYDVTAQARFRTRPSRLALPSGSSIPLLTADGSDSVTWTKTSGGGTLVGSTLSVDDGATGAIQLEAKDDFTGEKSTLAVRVLDELVRPTAAHGRLSDTGSAVAADFDGDGSQDLAVGIPESDLGRPQGGAVLVFRGGLGGLSAEPAWTLTGTSDTGQFGALLAAGDLDGDGRADLAVSSPGADVTIGDSGALFLYRFGDSGPVMMREPLTGLGRGQFGASVAIADVEGDGDMDLIVGSPAGDLAPTATVTRRGIVDIFQLQRGEAMPEFAGIRLGGKDLAPDGTLQDRTDLRIGRSLVVADLNGDGRNDLATVGAVNNTLLGGMAVAKNQLSISVYFSRGGLRPYGDTPDLYVLPANTLDTAEGTYRLAHVPGSASHPALLMVAIDLADSPDLSAMGGVKSGANSGGALFFDLNAYKPTGPPPSTPVQVGRDAAFARIYGDAGGIAAGRSFALVDVDGVPGLELVLGAPFATVTGQAVNGKLLVYPLQGLPPGTVMNKPIEAVAGARLDALGAAVATWQGPGGVGLVGLASRASTPQGAFTGRIDAFARMGPSLSGWMKTSANVPARAAAEQFGLWVAAAKGVGTKNVALVAAPGFAGPGVNNDGNDLNAGRAYLFASDAPKTAAVVAEGAAAPLAKAGRSVGTDVAFTDFDGDGRQDLVVAAPNMVAPGANVRAAEITPVYATEKAACVPAASVTVGGLLVHLGQADGTFKPAFKLWAPQVIAGCTPDTDAKCRRASIGRQVAGGFDFDGDGKEDLAVLRNNGFELFLGRAPDDSSLAKLTMGCDPVYTAAYTVQQTSMPTPLGDLNADGCDEVAYRYADGTRTGISILFGYDAGGTRCGGRTAPSVVRLSGDAETGSNLLGLGVAIARAGNFAGDGKPRLAVSATNVPVDGRPQPVVLLYEIAALVAQRPASGEAVVGALTGGLTPLMLAHPERPPSFGRALAGDVDLTGDGKPELVVGAPGASYGADGAGAVFIYSGGTLSGSYAEPMLVLAGDVDERGQLGQSLAIARGGAPALVVGAPTSYRTGTQNGTAFYLPLAF